MARRTIKIVELTDRYPTEFTWEIWQGGELYDDPQTSWDTKAEAQANAQDYLKRYQ